MSDYIEREAAQSAVWEEDNQTDMILAIGSLPAADVAPVRHGRWDENGRCTLCGGHAPFWAMASTYYKSPWCHECGARMDKEDEHETD